MTALTQAPEAGQDLDVEPDDAATSSGTPWRTIWRYTARPIFLAAALFGLYLYLSNTPMDNTTMRGLYSAAWLRNPDEVWQLGRIYSLTVGHIQLTVVSTVLVIAFTVPLGIICTRPWAGKIRPIALGLANVGQAVPSLGFITLIVLYTSTGFRGVVIGLFAYSVLPILRNTITGIEAVDPHLIESARGMGMSQRGVLRNIELPLAVPVMLTGIRVALIINVGTATLAFAFAAGGLGDLIFTGFQLNRTPVLIAGSVLAMVLALLIDYVAGVIEDVLKPRGL